MAKDQPEQQPSAADRLEQRRTDPTLPAVDPSAPPQGPSTSDSPDVGPPHESTPLGSAPPRDDLSQRGPNPAPTVPPGTGQPAPTPSGPSGPGSQPTPPRPSSVPGGGAPRTSGYSPGAMQSPPSGTATEPIAPPPDQPYAGFGTGGEHRVSTASGTDILSPAPPVDPSSVSRLEPVSERWPPPPADQPHQLRDDGPTKEEFVELGYNEADYPPFGYAVKYSPEDVERAQHKVIYDLEMAVTKGHGSAQDKELMAQAAGLIRHLLGIEEGELVFPVPPAPYGPVQNAPAIGHSLPDPLRDTGAARGKLPGGAGGPNPKGEPRPATGATSAGAAG